MVPEPADATGDPPGEAEGEAAPLGLAAGDATGVVALGVALPPLGVALVLLEVAALEAELLALLLELLLPPQAASKPAMTGALAPRATARRSSVRRLKVPVVDAAWLESAA